MEVDLEVGLLEAIKITIVDWSRIQELDYEQLIFKCTHCHEYGHFARHCKKKEEETMETRKANQWKTVKNPTGAKNKLRSKGKGGQ